ncbi:hypothetical protein C9I89_00950 [Photobacterium lipolyticum]|uniref:Uncharacterized protein n=1 Tax=Photobacterium lipolyticum TaxID=266810 RepID=A0A2T3N4F9_9GAMM|nr:hypothetical protein C9I89_00950 [Photobacterium lipolyticum]
MKMNLMAAISININVTSYDFGYLYWFNIYVSDTQTSSKSRIFLWFGYNGEVPWCSQEGAING